MIAANYWGSNSSLLYLPVASIDSINIIKQVFNQSFAMLTSSPSLSCFYDLSLFTGNSGLYLQASGSRLFFIFTTLIGLLLYLYLLLNIVVGLLTVYKSCIDYLIMKQIQKESTVRYKQFTDLAVVGLSYLTTFLFLIITAMAAILSGHGYLFGLFAVFDSVLTVGNLHVLAFVYPWNEIGFVISINLILLMGLSFFYTTCYVTFHFVSGNDFNELVQYWWGHSHDNGYEVVGQDEAGPFQAFMDKSMDKSANGGMKNGHGKEDDGKNPFLDDEDEAEPSGTNNFYSLTPDFLQHENEVSHDQAGTVGVTQENTSE